MCAVGPVGHCRKLTEWAAVEPSGRRWVFNGWWCWLPLQEGSWGFLGCYWNKRGRHGVALCSGQGAVWQLIRVGAVYDGGGYVLGGGGGGFGYNGQFPFASTSSTWTTTTVRGDCKMTASRVVCHCRKLTEWAAWVLSGRSWDFSGWASVVLGGSSSWRFQAATLQGGRALLCCEFARRAFGPFCYCRKLTELADVVLSGEAGFSVAGGLGGGCGALTGRLVVSGEVVG